MAKKMNTENNVVENEVPTVALYKLVETKQKQNVLNLDTNDDSEIAVITKKIVWLPFVSEDGKVSTESTTAQKMAALETLISPEEKKVIALERFYTSETYNESKAAALASGNFLTQQLRSAIVGLMQQNANFSELSAKDCFDRWSKGYKDGKAGPKQYLEQAKKLISPEEVDF